jgi:hypothetical protein
METSMKYSLMSVRQKSTMILFLYLVCFGVCTPTFLSRSDANSYVTILRVGLIYIYIFAPFHSHIFLFFGFLRVKAEISRVAEEPKSHMFIGFVY